MEETNTRQFKLRLAPELYDLLAEQARRDHRSMNAQIVYILESQTSVDPRQHSQIPVEKATFNN